MGFDCLKATSKKVKLAGLGWPHFRVGLPQNKFFFESAFF